MSTEIKDAVNLTPAEFKDYRFHTDCIRINLQTITDAAEEVLQSVAAVKDGKLYRNEYATFEDYVRGEFKKSPSWVYKKLQEIRVLENVDSLSTKPGTEQARHLATLPDEEQADAWAESQEKAESEGRDVPTTKDVKETVQKRKAANGGEYKPPKVDKPTKTVPVGPDLAVFDKLFGQAIRKYDECAAHYKWTDKREHGELLDAAGESSEKYAELVRGME